MNRNIVKKIINTAESLEWSVTYNGGGEFDFQKFSPAGQDFNMSISANSLDELKENLYEWYKNYDCSEEAYLWLDESGHGKNGAPYDMKDVYEDMEACVDMVKELAADIQNIQELNVGRHIKNRDDAR